MIIPILLHLEPDPTQSETFIRTLERVNQATTYLSRLAWKSRTFEPTELHKAHYRYLRAEYGLSAQAVVLMLSRVADAYRLDRSLDVPHIFNPNAPIPYDNRILSSHNNTISLWTINGRLKVPYLRNGSVDQMLDHQQGQSWLISDKNDWYLLVQINQEHFPEGPLKSLGIVA